MRTDASESDPAAAHRVSIPSERPSPGGRQNLIAEYLKDSAERCPGCGYGLKGLGTAMCPECGREVRLMVDTGRLGRGWWLFAAMGAAVGAAMAAGLLWMQLARIAEYYTTTNMAMVKSGFQPRLNVRWPVLVIEAGATVALLGIAAWAGALRGAFARRGLVWRVSVAVLLGAMPMMVVGLLWVWGVWREG